MMTNLRSLVFQKIDWKSFLFIWFWVLWLMQSAAAQPERIQFGQIPFENELSQNTVQCIVQDPKGFLWIGTSDGLNRYDGYRFQIYRNRPDDPQSLPNNDINALCVDRTGTLWIGTQGGGLCRYDPARDCFVSLRATGRTPSDLPDDNIREILEDANGTLWVGAFQGLFACDRDRTSWRAFRHDPRNPHSLPPFPVFALCSDLKGRLWVGTAGGGVCRADRADGTFTAFKNNPADPNSLSGDYIRSMYCDRQGNVWIGTRSAGLSRWVESEGRFRVYRNDPLQPRSLSQNTVRAMFQDSRGTFWVGTLGGGLCRYHPGPDDFTAFKTDTLVTGNIASNQVCTLFEDAAGILWIGTNGSGLCWYNPRLANFFTFRHDPNNPNSLSHNFVSKFWQDETGILWIGTIGGGLCRYDRQAGVITTYKHDPQRPDSIPNNDVYAVGQDARGVFWVGTSNGLAVLDRQSGRFRTYRNDPARPDSIGSNSIRCFLNDRQGRLWVGTYGGGLCRYNPETDGFTVYRSDPQNPKSLATNNVWTIEADPENRIWVGMGDGGLGCLNEANGEFTAYRPNPDVPGSLTGGTVWDIQFDRQGQMWVGTLGGGLCRFLPQTGTFEPWREINGLANDTVYAILEGNAGDFWLSTNHGLSCFSPQTRRFRNFEAADGLQANEFNFGSCFRTRDGEMFFGGVNGVTSFYPEAIVQNTYVPPVVFTDFRIFNQRPKLPVGIYAASEIEVTYRDNTLTFEFAALNFTSARKNQYAYRLEGFNRNWIQLGTQRTVTFTNLDPGTYVLRVKGSNNDGVWNETGATLILHVQPPLWKTGWAYLFYLVSTISLTVGGYRWRVRTLRERNRELEHKVAERTVELAENIEQLRLAKLEAERKNQELDQKIKEVARKNQELVASHQQADRIFSALAEALPGTVLDGKYRLDRKIGAGGFGAVFRGTQLALERAVAIKVFRPSPGNDSADAVERFRLEAISASRIQHPNAVAVLDSGISVEGIAYIVMELLAGHSLAQELKFRRQLSLRRTTEILTGVGNALAEAHRLGIIHRDIKPENIFLHRTAEGEVVKVVDFGIAKLVGNESGQDWQNLTATGGIVGTPTYMAPERLRNQPYDGKSDVYSLGVTVFEMLAGRPPFQSAVSGFVDIVMAHLQEIPPRLRDFNPALPPEIEELVLRALEKSPAQRPSAHEFAALFQTLAEPFWEPVAASEELWLDPATDISEVPTGTHSELLRVVGIPATETPANLTVQRTNPGFGSITQEVESDRTKEHKP
ncbi:MAG: protein kinase [Blastocatellia bacterium]|nr:protein kinase [Blastocatellia bacterium]